MLSNQVYVKKTKRSIIFFICTLLAFGLSCSLTQDQADEAAQIAMNVQASMVAQQATQLAQQATDLAQQSAALQQQQQQQQEQPIQTQPPVVTEAPPVVTEAPPVVTEAPPEQNVDEQIRNAKILLYEDMAGFKKMPEDYYPERYVKAALDSRGYSYKDDGSAMGWFKEDLLTTNTWDLIISSSESHDNIQGEFYEYMLPHLNRGAALIIEMWYLDDIVNGKIAPILSRCGVQYQADWPDPDSLALWPLVPDHPIFSQPNTGISTRKWEKWWPWEHGDLLKKGSGGDATMLLGTVATYKTDHATLVSCLQGRLIIQTFCSHNYTRSDIVPLWENYIYNALKSRFTTSP